jgi:hypothetical protein
MFQPTLWLRATHVTLPAGWYCSQEAYLFNTFISGLLPPVLLTLWEVFVVSFFMLYLVQAQNVHSSLSSTDRRFLRYYYVWGFINVLLGGITGGGPERNGAFEHHCLLYVYFRMSVKETLLGFGTLHMQWALTAVLLLFSAPAHGPSVHDVLFQVLLLPCR